MGGQSALGNRSRDVFALHLPCSSACPYKLSVCSRLVPQEKVIFNDS